MLALWKEGQKGESWDKKMGTLWGHLKEELKGLLKD
jgi:hypothetical protein